MSATGDDLNIADMTMSWCDEILILAPYIVFRNMRNLQLV